MKKGILAAVIVIALSGLFASCSNDGYSLDKFWIDIATVYNPGNNYGNYALVNDSNDTLWIAATNLPYYNPVTGQRLIINYTILNKEREHRYDIKLNDAYDVLTKPVGVIKTPDDDNKMGHDPIQINQSWIANDFLNIRFTYPGYTGTHHINLVLDSLNSTSPVIDGKVHLQFRHNEDGDSEQYLYNGIVSFNLKSLQNGGFPVTNNKIKLIVDYTNLNHKAQSIDNLVYDFSRNQQKTKITIPQEMLQNLSKNVQKIE